MPHESLLNLMVMLYSCHAKDIVCFDIIEKRNFATKQTNIVIHNYE